MPKEDETSGGKMQMKFSQVLWYMKTSVRGFSIQKAPQFIAKEAKAMGNFV